jgi:cation:H+ antiporter
MFDFLQLIAGLVILLYSGQYLVKGGVQLAQYLKVSRLVIGVTVVSFGTSAPELIVSVQAALAGHPDISMGNVIGSNISNIALVLAIAAIILPIPVRSNSLKFDWPYMMVASILLYVFTINLELNFIEGFIFFLMLIGFITYSIVRSRKKDKALLLQEQSQKLLPLWQTLVILVISAVGLVFGADWLVQGASNIALRMGVSERVISVSLIAFGTSVPELATSGVAAIKKESDISIGNIIGSNIFNILGVLGITGMITKIPVEDPRLVSVDIFWMLGISVLLFILILPLKGGILRRWKGALLFLVYISYIYLLYRA